MSDTEVVVDKKTGFVVTTPAGLPFYPGEHQKNAFVWFKFIDDDVEMLLSRISSDYDLHKFAAYRAAVQDGNPDTYDRESIQLQVLKWIEECTLDNGDFDEVILDQDFLLDYEQNNEEYRLGEFISVYPWGDGTTNRLLLMLS